MRKYRLRFYIDIGLILLLLAGSVFSSIYSKQIEGLISSHSLWTVLFILLQTVNIILIIGLVLRAGKMRANEKLRIKNEKLQDLNSEE